MSFYTFIPKLLNMSLTAGIVIVFVLLLRLCLKKLPKILSYTLWSVVLFRLLCPFSVEADVSLFRFFDTSVHKQNPLTNPIESIPENRIPISTLTCIWMLGVLIMCVYALIAYLRLRNKLTPSSPLRDNILLADGISSPFVMGLVRPKIYLPSSLSEREQPYILLHEQHHIHRLDHIVKAFSFAALCIHWFNPLAWVAFVLSGRDMEMSCDEAVIRKMGDGIRGDYAESLLRLATGKPILAVIPLSFGEGDTGKRIRNLANRTKPTFSATLLSVIVCIAAAVCLLTDPPSAGITESLSTVSLSKTPVNAPDTQTSEYVYLTTKYLSLTNADGKPLEIALDIFETLPKERTEK